MIKQGIFILLVLLPSCLLAQIGKGWSISPTLHTGFVLKHNSRLNIDNSGVSEGLTLNIQYQTYGLKAWQARNHFPRVGVQLAYFRMNNHDQLGSALGITPTIELPFIRKDRWNLYGQLGLGVAWLTKHYHPITNTSANAVGSRFNNYSVLGFFSERKWADQWAWSAGLSFTHFSNGAAKLPNYGLNIPAISLGLNYTPHSVKSTDFKHPESPDYRKWGFFLQTSAARNEFVGFNGPKYLIYNISGALTYSENSVNTSSFGLEYEYNYAVFNFYKFLEQFDEATTRDTGRRIMVFTGHQVSLGPVGIGVQMGLYVGPYRTSIFRPYYNKINLKYYLSPFGKKGMKAFVGIFMKAHLVEAEYFAVGMGIQL